MQLKPSYDILIFLNFNIAKTNTTVKIVHLYIHANENPFDPYQIAVSMQFMNS